MRFLFALTMAAALVMAGIPAMPSYGQTVVTPARVDAVTTNAAFVDLFNAFPNGGEQLSNRIADFLVTNPKLAPDFANYVVKTPSLSRAQKIAAEHGLAAALERLGINAADLGVPVKAPLPPAPVVEEGINPLWFVIVAAAIAGIVVCALECFRHHEEVVSVTKN